MAKRCQSCKKLVHDRYDECPFCGYAFAGGMEIDNTPPPRRRKRVAIDRTPRYEEYGSSTNRFFKVIAGVIIVSIIGFALYKYLMKDPAFRELKARTGERAEQIKAEKLTRGTKAKPSGLLDFDLTLALPGSPIGLVDTTDGFAVGNRIDPWGLMVLAESGARAYAVEKVIIREDTYKQKVSLRALASNGENFVSVMNGSWFEESGPDFFVTHDPETAEIIRRFPAPPLIGCIEWDGEGYWAATRKNTEGSDEPAFLYHLDENLEVIEKFEPPAAGCQGLAWDGQLLWWTDVFTDEIIILDVGGFSPKTIHRYETNFKYLSGVAYDGTDIWVAEYGGKKLYRLDRRLGALWAGGNFVIRDANLFGGIELVRAYGRGEVGLAKLLEPIERGQIKTSEFPYYIDWLVIYDLEEEVGQMLEEIVKLRTDAVLVAVAKRELDRLEEGVSASELEALDEDGAETLLGDIRREIAGDFADDFDGTSSAHDEYNYSFYKELAEDDAEVVSFSVDAVDGAIYGTWNVFFGPALFDGISAGDQNDPFVFPTFAKYEITISGGGLDDSIVVNYDAEPGNNELEEEAIATGLDSGKYTVGFFIHVQYKDGETNKILNKTIPDLKVEL